MSTTKPALFWWGLSAISRTYIQSCIKKHIYGHVATENFAFWTWIPDNGIVSIENIKFVINNQENEKQDVKNIMWPLFLAGAEIGGFMLVVCVVRDQFFMAFTV